MSSYTDAIKAIKDAFSAEKSGSIASHALDQVVEEKIEEIVKGWNLPEKGSPFYFTTQALELMNMFPGRLTTIGSVMSGVLKTNKNIFGKRYSMFISFLAGVMNGTSRGFDLNLRSLDNANKRLNVNKTARQVSDFWFRHIGTDEKKSEKEPHFLSVLKENQLLVMSALYKAVMVECTFDPEDGSAGAGSKLNGFAFQLREAFGKLTAEHMRAIAKVMKNVEPVYMSDAEARRKLARQLGKNPTKEEFEEFTHPGFQKKFALRVQHNGTIVYRITRSQEADSKVAKNRVEIKELQKTIEEIDRSDKKTRKKRADVRQVSLDNIKKLYEDNDRLQKDILSADKKQKLLASLYDVGDAAILAMKRDCKKRIIKYTVQDVVFKDPLKYGELVYPLILASAGKLSISSRMADSLDKSFDVPKIKNDLFVFLEAMGNKVLTRGDDNKFDGVNVLKVKEGLNAGIDYATKEAVRVINTVTDIVPEDNNVVVKSLFSLVGGVLLIVVLCAMAVGIDFALVEMFSGSWTLLSFPLSLALVMLALFCGLKCSLKRTPIVPNNNKDAEVS